MANENEESSAEKGARGPAEEVWPRMGETGENMKEAGVSGQAMVLYGTAFLLLVVGLVFGVGEKSLEPLLVPAGLALAFLWMARVLDLLIEIARNTRKD